MSRVEKDGLFLCAASEELLNKGSTSLEIRRRLISYSIYFTVPYEVPMPQLIHALTILYVDVLLMLVLSQYEA